MVLRVELQKGLKSVCGVKNLYCGRLSVRGSTRTIEIKGDSSCKNLLDIR